MTVLKQYPNTIYRELRNKGDEWTSIRQNYALFFTERWHWQVKNGGTSYIAS